MSRAWKLVMILMSLMIVSNRCIFRKQITYGITLKCSPTRSQCEHAGKLSEQCGDRQRVFLSVVSR